MTTETALERILANAQRIGGQFQVDDENREAVTRVAAWLAREPREGLEIGKGILLIGNVGTGKTLLMRALRAAMSDIWGVQFGIKPCAELVRDFGDCGYEAVEKWMTARHACFDDIGTEGEAIHFGKRTMVLSEIIESRYHRLTNGTTCWSHFTTNLGAAEMKAMYGERAYSRIIHMCNVVMLGGAVEARDRRMTAPPPVMDPHVNADNVYSIIHPDLAARLSGPIGELVEKIKADRPVELKRPQSAEEDRRLFAIACERMDEEELKLRRTMFIEGYPYNTQGHEEAMRYVLMIDRRLDVMRANTLCAK